MGAGAFQSFSMHEIYMSFKTNARKEHGFYAQSSNACAPFQCHLRGSFHAAEHGSKGRKISTHEALHERDSAIKICLM